MFNLWQATREYWRKLDELEASYHRGEVSPQEVEARVHELMAELGQERRATLNFLGNNLKRLWREQKEVLVGLTFLVFVTYAWAVVNI